MLSKENFYSLVLDKKNAEKNRSIAAVDYEKNPTSELELKKAQIIYLRHDTSENKFGMRGGCDLILMQNDFESEALKENALYLNMRMNNCPIELKNFQIKVL